MSQDSRLGKEGSALTVSITAGTPVRFQSLIEGRAQLAAPLQRGLVFYNPKMVMDRDLSILFTRSLRSSGRVSVLDATAGIGVRGIRYALEVNGIEELVLCDSNRLATKFCRLNTEMNSLPSRTTVFNADVQDFLATSQEFDIIDMDPFGSPINFFSAAVPALRVGGMVAVTATDLGTLSGCYPKTCLRRYGAKVTRSEFGKEIACRILLGALSRVASTLGREVHPTFCYAFAHYVRLFMRLRKAHNSLGSIGYFRYCNSCFRRVVGADLSSLDESCPSCDRPMKVIGPAWVGNLWDRETLEEVSGAANFSQYPSSGKIIGRLVAVAKDELGSAPTYYVTDAISRRLQVATPSRLAVMSRLREMGFSASGTIFDAKGIRTDADVETLDSIVIGEALEAGRRPLTRPSTTPSLGGKSLSSEVCSPAV